MKVLAFTAALLLSVSVAWADVPWTAYQQATVDALLWIQWNQWLQNGLLVGLIIAVIGKG